VTVTGLGLWLMASFDISGVDPWRSATTVLVAYVLSEGISIIIVFK
jgi:hypothetical protein